MRGSKVTTWASCVVALVVGVTGCASGERERLGRDLAAARVEIEELRRAQAVAADDNARRGEAQRVIEARTAAAAQDAAALRADVARLEGTVARTDATLQAVRTALDAVLERLVVLATPEPPLPPPTTPAVAAPAPPLPATPSPSARDASPDRLHAAAMLAFRAGEHGQAVIDFTEVVQKFPQHPLAPSAQYWIGEAYYRQRDYRQALAEFQKVADQYPRSGQVPDALLRLGLCHRAIRDIVGAREAWQRLATSYPASPAAGTARALLSGLAVSGVPGR
jgi:tol-pal system protein YbgF